MLAYLNPARYLAAAAAATPARNAAPPPAGGRLESASGQAESGTDSGQSRAGGAGQASELRRRVGAAASPGAHVHGLHDEVRSPNTFLLWSSTLTCGACDWDTFMQRKPEEAAWLQRPCLPDNNVKCYSGQRTNGLADSAADTAWTPLTKCVQTWAFSMWLQNYSPHTYD